MRLRQPEPACSPSRPNDGGPQQASVHGLAHVRLLLEGECPYRKKLQHRSCDGFTGQFGVGGGGEGIKIKSVVVNLADFQCPLVESEGFPLLRDNLKQKKNKNKTKTKCE